MQHVWNQQPDAQPRESEAQPAWTPRLQVRLNLAARCSSGHCVTAAFVTCSYKCSAKSCIGKCGMLGVHPCRTRRADCMLDNAREQKAAETPRQTPLWIPPLTSILNPTFTRVLVQRDPRERYSFRLP